MSISDHGPWDEAQALAERLGDTLGPRLVSAYVVGALSHGGHDASAPIELAVIVAGEHVTEDDEHAIAAVRRNAGIPCRLDLLCEADLAPPFEAAREVAPTVVRLADEGVRVHGDDVRETLVRPTRDDLIAYVAHVDEMVRHTLLRDDADEEPAPDALAMLVAMACRHHVFAKESLLIWRPVDAMTAFCLGHHTHPAAPMVRDFARAAGTGADPGHGPAEVASFWRDVHAEILK